MRADLNIRRSLAARRHGFTALAATVFAALVVTGCARIEMPVHLKPLSSEAMHLLGSKQMEVHAPIFVRVFKAESELEVWKQRSDGRFHHFKTYPICTWSGELGPKLRQGDKQAPEGFYTVNRHQMNPNSKFHLAFNLGYPNAYDKAHGRTGNFLMVHGECSSAGCYAMTNGPMEEIYALAREAFIGGQAEFHVHAFPFRMTDENMLRHAENENFEFWQMLKPAYDFFEETRVPPPIAICERRYVVNAVAPKRRRLSATGRCPRFDTLDVGPFSPKPDYDDTRVVSTGPKKRTAMLRLGGPVTTPKAPFLLGRTAPTSRAVSPRRAPRSSIDVFNEMNRR
jgi:murein L,D-transpeptidase YafK